MCIRDSAPGVRLSLVGDRQPLATLGAPALQDDATVLRRHADPEAVRLLSPALVRLICALALHVSGCLDWTKLRSYAALVSTVNVGRLRRTRGSGTARCKHLTRGSPNLPLPGRFRVCYSPLPFPALAGAYGWDWVSSPRFPQGVEKIVEKAPGRSSAGGKVRLTVAFSTTSGFSRPARYRYGSQYLGPDPLQNRNES